VLKQDQAVRGFLQHLFRLVQRVGVIQFRGKTALISGQDLPDQKEVFLFGSDQQNA
jgi:hypothetical protein